MAKQAEYIGAEQGPAVGADWLARNCSPATCERRAAEAEPMRRRVMWLLDLVMLVEASGGAMLAQFAERLDAGDFRDLMTARGVRDGLRA